MICLLSASCEWVAKRKFRGNFAGAAHKEGENEEERCNVDHYLTLPRHLLLRRSAEWRRLQKTRGASELRETCALDRRASSDHHRISCGRPEHCQWFRSGSVHAAGR